MYQFILLVHVLIAVCIIALVLVQQGKGATLGAAFGSGASQTIFGSRGSGSFLFRITVSFITIFFITSIVLNYIATSGYKHERGMALQFTEPVQLNVPVRKPAQSSVPPAQNTQKTTPAPTEIPVKHTS